MSPIFLGEHLYKTDEKGRISLPPSFREYLESGVILSRGLEKCVAAYPVGLWQRIAANHTVVPPVPAQARRMSRHMFGMASLAKFDAQGRILLPPPLRSYAEIDTDVVVIGVNSYIEIWSRENWAKEEAQMFEEAWRFSESVNAAEYERE